MTPSVRRPQNKVYRTFDGTELLIASDGWRNQQYTIHVIDHPNVEPGE